MIERQGLFTAALEDEIGMDFHDASGVGEILEKWPQSGHGRDGWRMIVYTVH
jgi:hypothetical protein